MFGKALAVRRGDPCGPDPDGGPGAGAATQLGAYSTSLRIPAAQAGPRHFVALLRVCSTPPTPVHGRWGSGQLLRTSLLSVLITSKGRLLAGAVTPAVLYADAAKVK